MIKGVTKTTENKTKQIKGQLLGMLLGNLEAISLRNILMIKDVITSGEGENFEIHPHLLANFEIQKH